MKRLLIAAVLLIAAGLAAAKTGVSLTVYNQNLALVRDSRTMEFKSGTSDVSFRDVAAQIDPTSVHFKANGVDLLEQNYDFDLVSPDKLLDKYVDKQIEVLAKNGDITRGTLLASGGSSGGQIVLRLADGSLRSLLVKNAAEIRYPDLPDGLITRPTLRWLVNAQSTGQREAEVSYLTGGISWHAEYVLVLNEANDHADLSAWVTLENNCGASYKDAKLKLIAGTINRVQTRGGRENMAAFAMDGMAKAAPQFAEQGFFEYHLYTLQRPTDILDRQTKQVSLFPDVAMSCRKIFEYDYQRSDKRVGVLVEFENREENGLGMALPGGKVRINQRASDSSQEFIGEDQIEHSPKNEKVKIRVGEAFDIVAERIQKDYRRISDRVSETDFEVKLRNHKKETVEVAVLDYPYGDWEILRSSVDYKKVSTNKIEFTVAVQPEQEAVLTYTIRTR